MNENKTKNQKKKDLLKTAKKIGKKKVSIGSIIIVLAVGLIVGAFVLPRTFQKEGPQTVVSESTLEKVVKTSTLSTYETVYNGIVPVMNEKKPEKVDYYISYEATVKAGLDFNEIEITKNDEDKKIVVTLPKISLLTPTVDEDLEYIIVSSKVKENGLFAEAYKLAKDDVANESTKQDVLLKYATDNAKNLIKGLLSPFVEQLESYEIIFE